MTLRLSDYPFIVVMMGIASLSMMGPALYAFSLNDFTGARAFFYGAILFSLLTVLLGIATQHDRPSSIARSQLTALLAAFSVLPLMLAVPFHEAAQGVAFGDAWFEMVSSFTTTGATLFDNPRNLTRPLHLWRAMVGWMGGLLIWVAAASILAPMNLGGFEVRSTATAGQGATDFRQFARSADPSERLTRFAAKLVPLYAGLTVLLWSGLTILGEVPFVALCHAMSVMATSGISPVGGIYYSGAGIGGEMLIFAFMVFALSRLTFGRGMMGEDRRGVFYDPEFRLGMFLVIVLPALLFMRHWIGATETSAGIGELQSGLRALWGSVFTVMSFLTTTGFESAGWLGAANWSGLSTPGLILVGLSMIGGGVATTAGGVKLLRVYALYKHSERELERLVHPSSVGRAGADARRIRKQGAYIAWIFFMLFALSIAGVMMLLSLTGAQFETAMVLAVAALSTTGPLAAVGAEAPISYAGLTGFAKYVLAAAMVVGRLEALAIIALLNPEFWRR